MAAGVDNHGRRQRRQAIGVSFARVIACPEAIADVQYLLGVPIGVGRHVVIVPVPTDIDEVVLRFYLRWDVC